VVVALAVPQFCKARKVHSCIHTQRETLARYKEDSARGLIFPLQCLGPASRPGILAKTWGTLNRLLSPSR